MKFIDMHCDTISAIYEAGKARISRAERDGTDPMEGGQGSGRLRKNEGHLDLERLKEGGCLAQSFALFTNIKKVQDPYGHASELCRVFEKEMGENADLIKPAVSVKELLKNEAEGTMSGILTIEDGAACRGSTELLREFYKKGVRMMTLTWNYENELGFPNRIDWNTGKCEPETERGLTKKGIEFVELMEELGMAVDVSHLGDAGFRDVARVSKKPFAASHSNARAAASHVRNLTDDMIRTLAERGGVMGINYCGAFLSDSEREKKGGESRIADMVRHIRHIRNVGGIGCIGLGSDFDGITGRLELSSPAAMGLLEEELYRQGFTEAEVEKIFWRNVLDFYKEVWRA